MIVSQNTFHAALIDSNQPVPEGLSGANSLPAGSRFSVYRNNFAVSLTEALELSFPAIRKLIGDDNFKSVMGVYLRRNPPKTPMLSQYGDTMPAFLEGFEPLQHIGYLPDVARLEQAVRESYHAADSTPIDPANLQDMDPEILLNSKVVLAPTVRLIRSPWPVHAIWAFNMEDGAPKPEAVAQSVLITRPDFDPQMSPISTGAAVFVATLDAGQTLSDAHDVATKEDQEFDLSQALSVLLNGHAIVKLNSGDTP